MVRIMNSQRPLLAPEWAAAVIVSTALLVGCATPAYQHPEPLPTLQASETEQQQADSLQHRLAQQQRLNRAAWPLLLANTEVCGKRVKASLGLQYANSHSFSGRPADTSSQAKSGQSGSSLRDTAIRTLQLGEAIQVLSVTPASPAEAAGLQPGDRLISLDSKPFQTGKKGFNQSAEIFRQLEPDLPVTLSVYRQQQTLDLSLTPVSVCDYPVTLSQNDQINAFADHRRIIITQGMLDFVSDDKDLALVIAHELAHNVLGHIPATLRNGLIGGSIDLLLLSQGIPSAGAFALGGLARYSQSFETEADYVALYLLARADYPLQGSADFWRQMSRSRPDHINSTTGQSHPGSADRYLIMQATIEEIRAKRIQQLPLTPNARKPQD